jgi:hypothetical protein
MSIQGKANFIRGFLESLEISETISQKQIRVLKEKLDELLEEIENFYSSEEDEEAEIRGNNKPIVPPIKESKNYNNDHDDLPF